MKKYLATTCALAAMTSMAIAQTPGAPESQTSAQKSGPESPSATAPSGPPTTMRSNQPGVQRVDGASLVVNFYTANPADTRATKLIGRTVYNLNNESIGEVNDLIIDNGKAIKAIVVGVGGFLGMGERNVAITPAAIVISEMADGAARLVVNTTKEDLKNAQPFNFADVDKAGPGTGVTTSSAPTKK